MSLETSSVCNLKCVMCPQSGNPKDLGRPRVFLSASMLEKIAPFLPHLKVIQLHGIGEPTLSPAFWKVLKTLSADCRVSVNTNFLDISDEQIAALVDSPMKIISISIDSPDKETYYRIRGADLSVVVGNAKKLVAKIKEMNSSLVVEFNMTLMKENILQINQALDLCVEVGLQGLETWPMNFGEGEHLNRNLRGWEFIYKDQLPSAFVELYNKQIKLAREHAEKIGTQFHSYFL